jgi:hypothetical protein
MFAARNAFMTGSAAPAAGVTFLDISSQQACGTSFSYTVPSNASLLAVIVALRGTSSSAAVSLDSVAMTKSLSNYSSGSNTLNIFTKLNPTPGVCTINPTADAGYRSVTGSLVFAVTYSNCVSLGSNYNNTINFGTSMSVTIPTVANSAGLYVLYTRVATTITASGTGLTSRAAGTQGTSYTYNIGEISGGGQISTTTAQSLSALGIASIQLLAT